MNKKFLEKNKKSFAMVFEQQFCGKHFDKIIAFPGTPVNIMEFLVFADVKEKVFFVDLKMLEDSKYPALIAYAEEHERQYSD